MQGRRVFLRYWLPVVLWLGLIFVASTDLFSSDHTSRIIGPLLRWLVPDVSEATIRSVQLVVRKGAHMGEYAVLALLLWRARRRPVGDDPRPWDWVEAGWVVLMVALGAALDEFHQSFVPSRGSSGWDVLLDVSGGVVGLLLLFLLGRWRRHW